MDLDGIRSVTTGLPIGLHVADVARRTEVRDTLNEGLRDARAYLREEVPARLHYRASPRIGDVVVIPDLPGAARQCQREACRAGAERQCQRKARRAAQDRAPTDEARAGRTGAHDYAGTGSAGTSSSSQ